MLPYYRVPQAPLSKTLGQSLRRRIRALEMSESDVFNLLLLLLHGLLSSQKLHHA